MRGQSVEVKEAKQWAVRTGKWGAVEGDSGGEQLFGRCDPSLFRLLAGGAARACRAAAAAAGFAPASLFQLTAARPGTARTVRGCHRAWRV